MTTSLAFEDVWTDRSLYEEAEEKYYEVLNRATKTPLADEVAKARQRLYEIRDNLEPIAEISTSIDTGAVKFMERKMLEFQKLLSNINEKLASFESRIQKVESRLNERPTLKKQPSHSIEIPKSEEKMEEDDEDIDLFGSDSDDDEEANKIREERLAAYNEKKSKKPTLTAKSSIILDVKPWDDETDMKEMEKTVREIEMDGLLWGASKLVPLAFGIHKLQINCVVEDDKVSIDVLQENIEDIKTYVQSVDIAAFNKI